MATAIAEQEIAIENNKGVERLVIPVPKGGGLVVLRGDNGSGKTEALNAVRAALGNKDAKSALRPSDDAKTGSVEAFGVTITIGRSNREKGELTVSSLEDMLDISDLVDPGIDDPNAADNRRLKSLLKVAGAKGGIEKFSALLGDKYELDADVRKERDLVKQAGGIKRSLEKRAREEEAIAETARLEAAACLKMTEGVDLEAPSNEADLQAEYKAAVQHDSQIDEKLGASERAEEARVEAENALAQAKAAYTGPTAEDAALAYEDAKVESGQLRQAVEDLEGQLRLAREKAAMSEAKVSKALVVLNSATQHFNTISAWEEQQKRDIPQAPTSDEIDAATARLEQATKLMQQGAIVRKALESQRQADEHTAKAKQHAKLADQWREAAKGVDEVLSNEVSGLGCPITVGEDDKGLRLMVQHRRGLIPFSELSAGEKWATVIPIAIKAVGEDGVFVIPQTAYEGLQPRVRRDIVAMLKGSHVTAITAECADGEITAEVAA